MLLPEKRLIGLLLAKISMLSLTGKQVKQRIMPIWNKLKTIRTSFKVNNAKDKYG